MTYYKGIGNMLTTGDIARLFGVRGGTARRWSNQGIIKAYRIGPRGERRFRREDAAAFLLERAAWKYLEATERPTEVRLIHNSRQLH